jgi:ribosomal protein S18 acetylase RimI-like enzyme
MPVVYRPMRPDEEAAALTLWMDVLETDADEALSTFRDFHDDPQRFDQSYVAVADDGMLLATVCYWLRDVRDTTGQPVRIGHLYHVATHPTARRQGHAGQLLDHTIQALEALDCRWAILGARQAAVPLYARHGWQAVSRSYWRGAFAGAPLALSRPLVVRLYDPRRETAGWQPLATVYSAANAHRAGSLIRDAAYWSGYAAWMFGLYLDRYHAVLLTVIDEAHASLIRGYALVIFSEMGFEVSEIVTLPDDSDALSSLLNGIITEALQRQIPLQGQLTLPSEPHTTVLLQRFFGATLHAVDDSALYGYNPFMAHLLQARDGGTIDVSPFTAPGSLFWPLDLY